jgi:hypothetical protein
MVPMNTKENRDASDEAVLKTIDIQQALILRMSSNSSTVKNWCVTVVAAVAVAAIEKGNTNFFWVSVSATVIFSVLDCYYLALERTFRRAHMEFAEHVCNSTNSDDMLFSVGKGEITFGDTFAALCSRSIWPFYILVVLASFTGFWLLR